ncbi:MAG TPA: succinate dehydrogenase, hydrophobic membrane anchor protein [Marinagarivorans sp.]
MVTTATNLSRNGVSDWIIQRFSAVILAAYTLFLAAFIIINPELDFQTWSNLFDQLWMRIFSLLALLSIAAHGWIGLWGVVTDYFTTRMLGTKGLVLRIITLSIYALITVGYLVWGFEILWGA